MSTDQEIRQQYFKQFNLFLKLVKRCLPDELELLESTSHFTVTDITGTYQAEIATIHRKNVPPDNHFVADIIPFGVTDSPGEGILELSGALGEERFIYLRRHLISHPEYHSGMFCLVSQEIDLSGWYWLKVSTNNQAIFVTCDLLLDLIKKVNCYECYPSEDDWIWE